MKKYIVLGLIFISATVSAQTDIERANVAYNDKNYQQAVELYEKVLTENGVSAEVYYNLGNAYFRMKQVAPAILNYERALLLDPGNRDIRHNLAYAQAQTVDKIEPIDEFFLTTAYNAVKNLFSANQWAYYAIACFLLFITGAALFFFTRRSVWKKIGFFGGLSFLVFCLMFNTFTYNQKKKLTQRNTAIIFAATITIKSTPDSSGADLFILHAGTKVELINPMGEWFEIETADGNVGWVKRSEIEII
ncbi:MAG: tetratricopeptide repeat protein [Candidatus Symbiothrix sp.]|jgi:tetratricopeptide (TPR) repeat protein|nr:tetratricopeptide repeat protein [Candidatus Symbiothrix sp.]